MSNAETIYSGEIWMPIPGYVGIYEVSSFGRVKSLARKVFVPPNHFRPISERLLKWRTDDFSTGYVYVSLCANGIEKKFSVHLLVLSAFVGPANGLWGLHKDGSRDNPRLENLYYGTPAQNSKDMIDHGNSKRGEKNSQSRMTAELVAWVKESKQSSIELGSILGLHSSTIRSARCNRNWSYEKTARHRARLG